MGFANGEPGTVVGLDSGSTKGTIGCACKPGSAFCSCRDGEVSPPTDCDRVNEAAFRFAAGLE